MSDGSWDPLTHKDLRPASAVSTELRVPVVTAYTLVSLQGTGVQHDTTWSLTPSLRSNDGRGVSASPALSIPHLPLSYSPVLLPTRLVTRPPTVPPARSSATAKRTLSRPFISSPSRISIPRHHLNSLCAAPLSISPHSAPPHSASALFPSPLSTHPPPLALSAPTPFSRTGGCRNPTLSQSQPTCLPRPRLSPLHTLTSSDLHHALQSTPLHATPRHTTSHPHHPPPHRIPPSGPSGPSGHSTHTLHVPLNLPLTNSYHYVYQKHIDSFPLISARRFL